MTVPLDRLWRCFQGVIPSMVATCARDGTPNVTYASQVYFVDAHRVALSCQFFNKTRRNLDENPRAAVEVYDPVTFDAYRLALRFDHSEPSGPLFDEMALRIQAIASHTGMAGVFRLLSADVFEVLSVDKLDGFLRPPSAEDRAAAPPDPHAGLRNELRGLQVISDRICRARDLDDLLTVTLASLEEVFGFRHSCVLLPDDDGDLVAIASRGYGTTGIGAEVAVGVGLIGTAAQERRPLRGGHHDVRYGRAIRARVAATGGGDALRPEIPLPGLPDARSQIALPLVVHDRLVGVLAIESPEALGFDEWHDAYLQVIANQIAIGIDRLLDDDDDEAAEAAVAAPGVAAAPAPVRFQFYASDDCVFVDGEYLIRNVPGRILWKLLTEHIRDGQREFTNRELRLDPWLGLPPIKDNLESRLILLRRRLEEKCPAVRIVPVRRGRFAIEVSAPIELSEKRT